jgi:hypothetical protein
VAVEVDEVTEVVTDQVVLAFGRLGDELRQAELEVLRLRSGRDALIVFLHDLGIPVTQLAKDASISRQSVYQAIHRHEDS